MAATGGVGGPEAGSGAVSAAIAGATAETRTGRACTRELAGHKGVTLPLLWLEYRERAAGRVSVQLFCHRYREWRGHLDVVLRQPQP